MEVVEGKQGSCDVESELSQRHIKNRERVPKQGWVELKRRRGEAGGKNEWRRNTVNLWGFVWLSMHA